MLEVVEAVGVDDEATGSVLEVNGHIFKLSVDVVCIEIDSFILTAVIRHGTVDLEILITRAHCQDVHVVSCTSYLNSTSLSTPLGIYDLHLSSLDLGAYNTIQSYVQSTTR